MAKFVHKIELLMALDRSFGLHAICVRVGAGHKEGGHKMEYLLEFTAFIYGSTKTINAVNVGECPKIGAARKIPAQKYILFTT
jgi:hypothetical protein